MSEQVIKSALDAIRELHRPFAIYDECPHDYHHEGDTDVISIDEIGLTCKDGLMYHICAECCCDEDGSQTLHCAEYHEHGPGFHICKTAGILYNAE